MCVEHSRQLLGDVEGFDSKQYERMLQQDSEAADELTATLKEVQEAVTTLLKLDKLANTPAMEQRLCSGHPFARVGEARQALAVWQEVVSKKQELQSRVEEAQACAQECFVLKSLLLEDHSPRETKRLCGLQLNRVRERLPTIRSLGGDLSETFNRFEMLYLPLVQMIQADEYVSGNSRYIMRLLEYPMLREKVNSCYDTIMEDVTMAEESITKHEKCINRVLLHRSRQRNEFEEMRKTMLICPSCHAINDPDADNCITCGKLLRKLLCVCSILG